MIYPPKTLSFFPAATFMPTPLVPSLTLLETEALSLIVSSPFLTVTAGEFLLLFFSIFALSANTHCPSDKTVGLAVLS